MRFVLVPAAIWLVSACNSRGTCLHERPDESLSNPSECWVNEDSRSCNEARGTFFKESPSAGMLRCKAAGFEAGKQSGKELLDGNAAAFLRFGKPAK